MAEVIMPLLDTDEVQNILHTYFEGDDDYDAIMELLMGSVGDGTIKDFVYDTFDTWAFENYWECVEVAVTDWANDLIGRANDTEE